MAPATGGDESALARLCAQKAGRELMEQHRTGAQVPLESLLHAPLYPEPINYMGWLEHIQLEAPTARERGASAIFTGQGGNEIFARTGAAWAVRDFASRHGARPSLFAKAMGAARQEQLSVWEVLHRALSGARWHPQAEADSQSEDPGEPALRDILSVAN